MSLIQSAFLGFIQGLTEYLPISSTAHLRIVPAALGWDDPGAAYSAVIQLGSVLAVLFYFRRDLTRLVVRPEERRTLGAIVAATIPISIAGLLFRSVIENEFRSLVIIAGALIVVAVAMAITERIGKRTRIALTLSFWEIQFIGIAQALALIPGVSRSGVTLTAALLIGLRRDEAARFSFLLGVPAITAAGVFQLKELIEVGVTDVAVLVVGTATAFISSLIAIDGLIRYLKTQSTMIFIIYRILLGIGILALAVP